MSEPIKWEKSVRMPQGACSESSSTIRDQNFFSIKFTSNRRLKITTNVLRKSERKIIIS